MSDIEFVNGLIAKAPNPKAPDFVKASLSIKRVELIVWLHDRTEDWINVDVKESKSGKWYCQIQTWKPDKQNTNVERKNINNDPEEIPF